MNPKPLSLPELSALLPLTETEFFILLSLVPEPRHGYAIMKDVLSLSGGRLSLGTGTLYGALKRMLEREWIVRREGKEPWKETGRTRKSYALSALGRSILGAETNRLQILVRAARQSRAGGKA
jgi:DNA-binding PadR family transcriptional regulator